MRFIGAFQSNRPHSSQTLPGNLFAATKKPTWPQRHERTASNQCSLSNGAFVSSLAGGYCNSSNFVQTHSQTRAHNYRQVGCSFIWSPLEWRARVASHLQAYVNVGYAFCVSRRVVAGLSKSKNYRQVKLGPAQWAPIKSFGWLEPSDRPI